MTLRSRRAIAEGLLPLILLMAAAVRVWGIEFCLPHVDCRPDEVTVASMATGLYGESLNPHQFTYPPLLMLGVAVVLKLVHASQSALTRLGVSSAIDVTSSATKILVARLISASAGVATVLIVYHAAARLANRRAGLAAAALMAVAFLSVRDSHFGVTDVPMTCLIALAFLGVVTVMQSGRTRDLAWAAVVTGLATATKYNAAFMAVPAAAALLTDESRPLRSRLSRVGLFAGVMVAGYALAAPYSLIEWRQTIADVTREGHHLANGHGILLGRGWLYHLTTTLRYGVGWPVLACGLVGLAWLWRQPRVGFIVVLFPMTYYLVAGSGLTVFTRYMQPEVPFLCLAAGLTVAWSADGLARALTRPAWTAALTAGMTVAILIPSLRAVLSFDRLMDKLDTRVIARRWIEARVPAGSMVIQFGHGFVFTQDASEVPYVDGNLEDGLRPDVVIVSSSALHDEPDMSPHAARLASEYTLALTLDASVLDPSNVYDRQDDFYLPMSGFAGVSRPGPNLRVYVRNDLRPALNGRP